MIDLKSWEKIGDTKSHMIYEHPDGHQMHVAKMPKFADGGEVFGQSNASNPAPIPIPSPQESYAQQLASLPTSPIDQLPAPSAPVPNSDAPAGTVPGPEAVGGNAAQQGIIQSGDPYGLNTQSSIEQKGIQDQLAGIQGGAAAQGALGKAQAGILNQGASGLQKIDSDLKANTDVLHDKLNKVEEAAANGQIDPGRFYNNLDTGQKIATGIGLILGGIGAGLTHGQNPVLEMINNAINRDVDAQKADLNNKHSLVAAYQHDLGNREDAAKMATASLQTQTINKLNAAAANAQTPIQAAAAQQAAGILKQQVAQTVGGLAAKQTLLGGVSGPEGTTGQAPANDIDPAVKINYLIPPNLQSKALDELNDYKHVQNVNNSMLDTFDKMAKFGYSNYFPGGDYDISKYNSLKSDVDKLTKDTAGRVTPISVELLSGLYPERGDTASDIAFKRTQFQSLINRDIKPTSTLLAHHISLPGQDAHGNATVQAPDLNQQAKQWLAQNPNSPLAPQIRQKLGM